MSQNLLEFILVSRSPIGSINMRSKTANHFGRFSRYNALYRELKQDKFNFSWTSPFLIWRHIKV